MDGGDRFEKFSLIDIANQRNSDEEMRDGKSGEITYEIQYHQDAGTNSVQGKVIEVGDISNSKHKDLKKLVDSGYTQYAIFRLKDRTTTTIVQDNNGNLFKVFSFSLNDVKVSYPVTINDIKE